MAELMKGLKRTHRCAEITAANAGETVTVMGWVQKNRNKGGLVFVDVRDPCLARILAVSRTVSEGFQFSPKTTMEEHSSLCRGQSSF